jgi:transmembrane sensor
MFGKEKSSERIEREACEWLAVLNSDRGTAEETARFRTWLQADPLHEEVYERVRGVWEELAALKDFAGIPDADTSSTRQPLHEGGESRFRNHRTWFRGDRLFRAAAVICIVTAMALMAAYLISTQNLRAGNGEVATQTAEIREVTLPDGSTVTVGAQSAIEVHYGEVVRRVDLMAGEAFFSVNKDPSRPFIVSTANAEIRVTGTQFDVRRADEALEVAVLRGKVEVRARQGKSAGPRRLLTSNQKIRIIPNAALPEPRSLGREKPGAWRQGRLIYEDTRLSEVIADANRYYNGNILIDSQSLGDLMVSAAFRSDQIDKMMQTLAAVLPISVKKLSNGDILLRRKSAAAD